MDHYYLKCICTGRVDWACVPFFSNTLLHPHSHIHTGTRPVKPVRCWLLNGFPATTGELHTFFKGTWIVSKESKCHFFPLSFLLSPLVCFFKYHAKFYMEIIYTVNVIVALFLFCFSFTYFLLIFSLIFWFF